ncbi:Dedicator of cytokinesis protein 3 [Psilocybe cubensis]|uniref:Dedicator of cytokinesis protein 3 n=2 Tax=Psilocybe cubensis TaxID=181762 RepID=A0ACB8HDS0_PSICU|nr:Dedicator of cytokinesis protein 3 [Psilocybe cubensis]KAH9485300.1 Dedicator of cytokinesis protein 3 [Psilocybe cubensis]
MWEPLPLIVYGYAVHPLSPSRRETRHSSRNRLSTVTEASSDDHSVMKDVVSLEVGDEVYAFEKYVPSSRDQVEGIWYRGYVLCTTRRPPVTWSLSDPSSSTSLSRPLVKVEETQQVFIGIFPASHIFVRDELSDAEGRLPDLARTLQGGYSASSSSGFQGRGSPGDALGNWNRDKASIGMGPLREEEDDSDAYVSRTSFKLGPPPDQANSSRAALPVYPTSLRSSSPADSHVMKPLPPRPSRKSGDDTASGAQQPIIDEIASALREWHTLMFQYLARRDYKLFHIVREHIEALHLGRRQLLAQTLSAEETVNMRRDCVTRLVSGNLVQGLDVIVRHPTWGGLVTVDVEGETDPRSWVSAVRMYAMQVSLAYLNVTYDESRPYPLGPSSEYVPSAPLPTPAHSAFPDFLHHRNRSRSQTWLDAEDPLKQSTAKFYHVFLDLRAFVASPCTPGETAELFFSLYRKQGTQFVTEEFCAVLNHNGVLARDPSSRIRTLFVDLATSDIQDPIYLVCRIVRNGALKIGSSMSSSALGDGRRGSETSLRTDSLSPTTITWNDSVAASTSTLVSPSSGRPNGFGEPVQFRRPFGCAVLELTQLAKMVSEQADVTPLREYTMPIYIPTNEASFSMIHQNIINNNTKEFEKSPRAEGLAVSVKVFRGNAKTVVRENTALLQDIPHTLRLGFPDVVFPGDARNELYIKLWCGDFTLSHNGSGRLNVANFARGQMGHPSVNVQITVEVKDQNGTTIENVISQGSGEPLMTQFNSMVFMRCNEPTFGELIKIQLPLNEVPNWHLFFTFRNRSSRSSSKYMLEGGDRPFAFAFQPLFPDASAFVEDGGHTLIMYRADKLGQIVPSTYLNSPFRLSAGQKIEHVSIPADLLRLSSPLKDTLTIRTSLCSTKHTQNVDLLRLLNWEKQDKDHLSTLLNRFTFVGEGEIVKFLRDIFDSLFGILVSQNNPSGELDLLVFNALVTILGIVQDRRFSNFQPVLDVYIEKHFSCAAASSHIIHSMNRLVTNPTSPETASPLRAALKVWHYIFKFIARSRELQKVKEVGMGGGATVDYLETTFKRELRSHLSNFTQIMSTSSPPSIIGTQTIALQHFTSILPELAKIYTTVELVSIATTFANAVTVGKGKIVNWKLIMYLQIVKSFLFDNAESRPFLVEAVVIWIKPHFGRYDEFAHTSSNDSESARDAARVTWMESIRLCVTIIAVMLDKLNQYLTDPAIVSDRAALNKEQDNVELLLSLIPRLLDSYREIQSPASKRAIEKTKSPSTIKSSVPVTFPESYPFSLISSLPEPPTGVSNIPLTQDGEGEFYPALGEVAVVFLVLILSSPIKYITAFLESSLEIEGRERFVALLSQFFKVATSLLENDAFPKSWMNINILAHKVLIKIMDPIASIMEKEFIPPPELESRFDPSLWREGLHMLLKLLSSEQLMIEDFSPQKRRAVWRLTGDIRGEGAAILLSLWQALGSAEHVSTTGEPAMRYGGYQIYLHALVGHVVNLCLSHHDQLRNNAVQILYSMIVSEYHQSEHFDGIENELVTRLDSLFMSDSKGDDISRAFFIGQLRHMFDTSDVDEQLRDQLSNFLDSVDLFLELLLSVRALPEGEEYADDRVIATLRLMNFIRRIGRDEIYIKYVHQLVNMHLQSQNYVEAALTLKLHSDLHAWDLNSFVPPMEDLGLPQQSHFHRKETLCLLILDYLGKGKAWESAIEICKELAYQHAEVTFNYGRLSEILRHQATLLEHIVTDQRYYPDYYRVTFYGNFPAAIRDKRFIYRGYEWEKFGAFCERMLNKHPGSQLLKTAGEPPVDIRYGNDQYIQCTAVTPEPDRDLPVFTNPDVPLAVRTYYEHSGINLFSSSRQIRKTTRDGMEEIWTEKTYYTTEQVFPTVLRRSEVVNVEFVEISPLENALQEVEDKTKELIGLHLKYQALAKTAQNVSTNALAMSLNSAVDAPLNTGVASYRQIFFSPDYIARNPERAELVEKLRQAIDEQVRIIDSCLKLHGLLCPPEFIPFHETLEKFFKKNFRDEIRRLAVDADSIALSTRSQNIGLGAASSGSQYPIPSTSYEQSVKRSMSSSSTARFQSQPINVGRSMLTPTFESPMGPGDDSNNAHSNSSSASKQTPLQRHLAHLTRHGINGVSSAPGDLAGVDSLSAESPHNSFVNVGSANGMGNGNGIHSTAAGQVSGASVATSYMGSMGSFGSLKSRFSRFGSLNFGRRGGSNS